MSPTTILGINAWHPDASACLIVEGRVVAAAEEERFGRIKHVAGFPAEAVRWCVREAGIEPEELSWIAVNRDPNAAVVRKAAHALRRVTKPATLGSRLSNRRRVLDTHGWVRSVLGADTLSARFAQVEHHRAHLASSFLVSPFERAAVVSIDGFGDFASSAWGLGEGNAVDVRRRTHFPHSLGLLYLAITQLLGFPNYGDEYKVMGMAAYGEPRFLDSMRKLVRLESGGRFRLALRYFVHHTEGVEMNWEGGSPALGTAFSPALVELLGPTRGPEQPLEQRHFDLAASLQALYEEALYHHLRAVAAATGETRLCLSGGCAMNGLANGRIREQTPFEELYIPPAPGDAGGAMGAALDVWCGELDRQRVFTLDHAYLGPRFEEASVASLLRDEHARILDANCSVRRVADPAELCGAVADRIARGEVVGWFQERMEWGPRALGNRSILADPRRSDVRELLNGKIKLRESFRPFAPSVLAEHAGEWFELAGEVPFMLEIRDVREERRESVPAITHVDGTGRLQTVRSEVNPRYHALIRAFYERTGVPMVLNTSFNENEPVVCKPSEALDCFLRTRMDVLVLGDHVIERRAA